MVSGDSKVLEIEIGDDDGVSVDVTGANITYAIADRAIRVTKQTGGQGVTIDGSLVTVTLSPADTAGLAGVYSHEMEIVDMEGNVSTVLRGQVGIARGIV